MTFHSKDIALSAIKVGRASLFLGRHRTALRRLERLLFNGRRHPWCSRPDHRNGDTESTLPLRRRRRAAILRREKTLVGPCLMPATSVRRLESRVSACVSPVEWALKPTRHRRLDLQMGAEGNPTHMRLDLQMGATTAPGRDAREDALRRIWIIATVRAPEACLKPLTWVDFSPRETEAVTWTT